MSFLSRLLRPDRKDKSKERHDVRKRHSVPNPDWMIECHVNATSTKQPNFPSGDKKQKKKTETAQIVKGNPQSTDKKTVSNINRKNQKKSKDSLSNFLCLSGKVDTLERTPMPENAFASNTNHKGMEKNVKNKADFIRKRNKSKNETSKNRHSAPVPGWLAFQMNGDLEVSKEEERTYSPARKRELSPNVKYRVDGTLERPYVFPGGLTFGPEGRKIPLRRTSPESGRSSRQRNCASKRLVKADIHSPSKENLIIEYSFEEEASEHEKEDKFDVRKAFFLKYDLNIVHRDQQSLNRRSMPVLPSSFGSNDSSSEDDSSEIITEINFPPSNLSVEEDEKDRQDEHEDRQSRRGRTRKRYSMPPKNDACVYMGSFENLTVGPARKNNSGETRTRDSNVKAKRDKSNRYSLPPKNSDFVYMGSFENIFSNSDLKIVPVLTPPKPFNVNDAGRARGDNSDNPVCKDQTSDQQRYRDRTESPNNVKVTGNKPQVNDNVPRNNNSSLRRDTQSHSLPQLAFPGHLSIAKSDRLNSDVKNESEAEDLYDNNFSLSQTLSPPVKSSLFSRNLGRSSCMPGNKRTVAPPPVIVPAETCTDTDQQRLRGSKRFPYLPGNRRFSIPPPPDCNPPKEDMASAQKQLSELTCHKGSQANLSMELECLDMEDRDMSLTKAEAKTIIAGLSAHCPKGRNTAKLTPEGTSDNGVQKFANIAGHRSQVSVSEMSEGSDDVFTDNSHILASNHIQMNPSNQRSSKVLRIQQDITPKFHSTVDTPPVSFSGFRPQAEENNEKAVKVRSKETTMKLQSQTGKNAKYQDRSENVTSTPKSVRRPVRTNSDDHEKPVPFPRKSNVLDLNRSYSDVTHERMSAAPNKIKPPVPLRRNNVTSQGTCALSQSETDVSRATETLKPSHSESQNDHEFGNGKERNSGTLTRDEKQSDYSTDNTYEEIESARLAPLQADGQYEDTDHIYATCDEVQVLWEEIHRSCQRNKPDSPFENSPITELGYRHDINDILPLASSPRPSRRHDRKVSCMEGLTHFQRPYYFGLSASLIDLTEILTNKGLASHYTQAHTDSDEDDSIADDEMSGSNDEYQEECIKKRSLRKCVSVDDLLRSGSILDRSMILAQKRRLRMRQKNSTNRKPISKGTGGVLEVPHYYKQHSSKLPSYRKKSGGYDLHFKHKQSHTDSGHDSDMISPCTSPDARQLLGNGAYINEVIDSCAPRQGTLTKKPWEIRLQNKQWVRKCRSRDSVFSPTRLEIISKSTVETEV